MKRTSRVTRMFIWSLALLIVCPIELRKALGDERPTKPDIGLSTFELLTYQATNYRFLVIPADATPPSGFEHPGFDDTDFTTGNAAFGAGEGASGDSVVCPLQSTVQTNWPLETQLLVRRVVSIPEGASNVRIMVSVDNDIIGVFVNGTRIAKNIRHGECPILDEFRFDVPEELVQPGPNLIAFHVQDRPPEIGPVNESFFDTRILAELSPDQLPEAVVVEGPVVPLSDVEVSSRPDPDGERSSITIRYVVPGTGELGEVRIEQLSPDSITVETLLEGRQIAFGSSTPNHTTSLSFPGATEGLTDTAILSADSIFADRTVTEVLVRGLATSAALTCEDACFQKARLADMATSTATVANTCEGRGFFCRVAKAVVTAVFRSQRIAPEVTKCQATCPAGNLIIGVTVSQVPGTQPSQSRVIASGQLCTAEGAVGATSFNVVGPTQTVNPGRNRPAGTVEVRNLRRGIWEVAAAAQGLTGFGCQRVRVDGFVTIIPGQNLCRPGGSFCID